MPFALQPAVIEAPKQRRRRLMFVGVMEARLDVAVSLVGVGVS